MILSGNVHIKFLHVKITYIDKKKHFNEFVPKVFIKTSRDKPPLII